jgi:hypothetical protein
MQAGKLFERSAAARKIIALVAVDRHDQIFEEAAILRVDRAAMTCKRQLMPMDTIRCPTHPASASRSMRTSSRHIG